LQASGSKVALSKGTKGKATTSKKGKQPVKQAQRRVSRPTQPTRKSTRKRARSPSVERSAKRRVSRPSQPPSKRGRSASSKGLSRRVRQEQSSSSSSSAPSSTDETNSDGFSSSEDVEEEPSTKTGVIPAVPSTSHVPPKTKKKIIKGEYVDISKLLPTLFEYEEAEVEKSGKSKNLSFYEWVRCFRTFMSIRLSHAPQELQGMLRHGEIVQDLHEQERDGILYDARFRRKKEQHPFIRWGEYLADVVDSLPKRKRFGGPSSAFTPPRSWHPQPRPQYGPPMSTPASLPRSAAAANVCIRFNTPQGCSLRQCRYIHRCARCGRPSHPSIKCFARVQPKNELR